MRNLPTTTTGHTAYAATNAAARTAYSPWRTVGLVLALPVLLPAAAVYALLHAAASC